VTIIEAENFDYVDGNTGTVVEAHEVGVLEGEL